MAQRRTLSPRALLLCAVILIVLTLSARILYTTVGSSGTTKEPCGNPDGFDRPKSSGEGVQSVNCQSAKDCLTQAQQYLAEASDMNMPQHMLEKALALEPDNAEAYKLLASTYLGYYEKIGVGHPSEEDYCRAEAACRSAISHKPDDPKTFLLLGRILNGQVSSGFRSDDQGVKVLKKAIELKPQYADCYCELGHTYDLLKRYEEAADAYSVEANLRRQNEAKQSQSDLVTSESQRNHEVKDSFLLAQIYTKLGEYEKALTPLQHAASIKPKDHVIRFWIGKTYLSLGDIQSAKREQVVLAEMCNATDKFFVEQCKVSAKVLLDAIELKTK
jgi:tetratricopeptide (TPR) repeat protein